MTATDEACVVVFPDIFAKKKIPQLISNIKTVLRIRKQEFGSVVRDGDIIQVHANDPVFASSAIGLLFGVSRVAIAKRTGNGYGGLVSKIASIGGNLLLKNERFLVRVEGDTKGYIAKDAEIAATSKIIEKKELGAVPGTESKFDKEIYTYVTQKNAYVCIFSDGAMWGVPSDKSAAENRRTICAIYDEISALSCFECMRQGYDVRVIVFYKRRSDLLGLARLLNRLIPRMLSAKTELEFVRMKGNSRGARYAAYVGAVTDEVLKMGHKDQRVALAIPPGVFSADVLDRYLIKVFEHGMIPLVPLAGSGTEVYEIARETGMSEKNIKSLEKTISAASVSSATATDAYTAEPAQRITVETGVNNVHDILDSLYPS